MSAQATGTGSDGQGREAGVLPSPVARHEAGSRPLDRRRGWPFQMAVEGRASGGPAQGAGSHHAWLRRPRGQALRHGLREPPGRAGLLPRLHFHPQARHQKDGASPMSVYVPARSSPSAPLAAKAVLGQGAAAIQTLNPLYSIVRDPASMMRMAQMLFHSNRYVFKAESTVSFNFSTVDWHLEDGQDNEILAETATGPSLAGLNLIEKPQAALTEG